MRLWPISHLNGVIYKPFVQEWSGKLLLMLKKTPFELSIQQENQEASNLPSVAGTMVVVVLGQPGPCHLVRHFKSFPHLPQKWPPSFPCWGHPGAPICPLSGPTLRCYANLRPLTRARSNLPNQPTHRTSQLPLGAPPEHKPLARPR